MPETSLGRCLDLS